MPRRIKFRRHPQQLSPGVIMGATQGKGALSVIAGGGSMLFVEEFADTNFAARDWYTSQAVVVTDPVPPGASGSFQLAWAQSANTPTNGSGMRKRLTTPSESIWIRAKVRHDANWVGSGESGQPHLIGGMSDADPQWWGPSDTHLNFLMDLNFVSGQGVRSWMSLQDNQEIDSTVSNMYPNQSALEARATGGANGRQGYADGWDLFPTPGSPDFGSWSHGYYNARVLTTSPLITPGDTAWHTYELELVMNSIVGGIGQLNGIARVWWDGVLKYERTDLIMRTGSRPTLKFGEVYILPYMSNGSPIAQTMWISDLVVRTARPVGVASQLAMVTQPSGAVDNLAFGGQPAVRLQDQAGNNISQSGVTLTARVYSGSGSLIGTATAVTNSSGIATWTNLGVNATSPPSNFAVDFAGPAGSGISGVASNQFSVGASAWLANKPANYVTFSEVDFTQSIPAPPGDPNAAAPIGTTGWTVPFAQSHVQYLSQESDAASPGSPPSCWKITIPAGSYGGGVVGEGGGTGFGDFGVDVTQYGGAYKQDIYACVAVKWGLDDGGLDYEWHPISNKWFEIDSPNLVQMLCQANQDFNGPGDGLSMVPQFEYRPGGGWSGNMQPEDWFDNSLPTSGVWHIVEILANRGGDGTTWAGRFRVWMDGVLRGDWDPIWFPIEPGAGYQELYFRNFRGGGGEIKTRQSYLHYGHILLASPQI